MVEYSEFSERFQASFLIIVIAAALFGNGFVCMAVYWVRRLQKISNFFLISLAVSDILVVIFSAPFRVYFAFNVNWDLGEHTCKFWIFIDLLCNTASIINLSLISADRYLALSRTLRYATIVTFSRCCKAILAVWLYAFTIAVLSFFTWSSDGNFVSYPQCVKQDKLFYAFSLISGILVPMVILFVLYCLVFKIAVKQQRKIIQNHSKPLIATVETKGSRSDAKTRRFTIRELKATKTLIIVVGAFLICWLPIVVIMVMQQYANSYVRTLPKKTQEILGLLFLYTLPYLNSCLNPYIYTFHNAEFRAVFTETFSKLLPAFKCLSRKDDGDELKAVDTDETC